jgi:hypothetical protein
MSQGVLIREFRKGEMFGFKSVLLGISRTMDIITKTDCVIYSISVESLRKIIGDNFRGVIYMIMIKQAFKNSRLLNHFDPLLLDKTYPAFSIKNYFNNEIVVEAGSLMRDRIFIIIEGSLYKVKSFKYRMVINMLKLVIYYLRRKYILIPTMLQMMIY